MDDNFTIRESDNFVKGYITDAAVDIVMQEDGSIPSGFSRVQLPIKYTPEYGEVAVVVARTSTQNRGLFAPIGLIDPGYEGTISAWVFNTNPTQFDYKAGDRLFSIVNLRIAPPRVAFKIVNGFKVRGKNNVGSSGGHSDAKAE